MARSPAWFSEARRLPSSLRKLNWYAAASVTSFLREIVRVIAVEEPESQALPAKESSREAMPSWVEVAYAGGRNSKSSLNCEVVPSVVMARPEFQCALTYIWILPCPGPFHASIARPTTMPGFVDFMP